ncbi:MAG: RNA-binding S4 domain protein [Thermotoga sp. 50_1627]|nr:MAG: RNA-binding S4 domain protein [Thermotoga sp. 50_64]KUK25083.1 MAG: RNA-binding S4 domain protein [Thermotoga sp. 50_1627]MDK2923848.1 rRNA pseudouridine516 synthase [Pseudothermotoga sp.]HBT39487.1 rRNA pseudouridine synthase [Pseudothermotoga sp.]HCO97154.1 rRNA pseudouridine synthase [Pseudothermotoga sp.]
MRLDKYLANSAVGTRSQVKRLIRDGYVSVNGNIVRDPSFRVKENDVVECLNQRVEPPGHTYLALYKPAGYVCDKVDDANIFDLIDHPRSRELHAAGRLDRNVEGLVILTTDGWFTHLLIDPKSRLEREYLVWVEGKIDAEMKYRVELGFELNQERFAPAEIEEVEEGLVKLVLTEGKYHEVKRIIKAIGLKYKRIVRTRFENITLQGLVPGGYRELREEEVRAIVEIATKNRLKSRSKGL